MAAEVEAAVAPEAEAAGEEGEEGGAVVAGDQGSSLLSETSASTYNAVPIEIASSHTRKAPHTQGVTKRCFEELVKQAWDDPASTTALRVPCAPTSGSLGFVTRGLCNETRLSIDRPLP